MNDEFLSNPNKNQTQTNSKTTKKSTKTNFKHQPTHTKSKKNLLNRRTLRSQPISSQPTLEAWKEGKPWLRRSGDFHAKQTKTTFWRKALSLKKPNFRNGHMLMPKTDVDFFQKSIITKHVCFQKNTGLWKRPICFVQKDGRDW